MQHIADWLEKLGLGQYAQRFAENHINFGILADLTDQDLKEIGISSLGHRRQLLRAIAELGVTSIAVTAPGPVVAGAPAMPSPTPASARPPMAAPAALGGEAVGERRHVTVMFGYPVAQENDAERAVRAALAIQRALTELNRRNAGSGKPALAARIAVESGPVGVDAEGEIFGDVPNIASRAQALAEPGAVVVTARVQRQVAGLFVAEERGSHELKGVPEPVTLFRLVRASGGGRRGGQRNLTPLVGREEEIAMLLRRWERARQGDGQLLLIVGEPGLGKSRLIEEFHARLLEVPHTWVEWSCSQLLQNTALHPITEWGRLRFGGTEVPAEQRLTDLESSLKQVNLDPLENTSLLAPLLDIPLASEQATALLPEELRRRQL